MPASEPASTAVIVWWIGLSTVSVVNIALWFRVRRSVERSRATLTAAQYAERRRLLWLAAAFTFVCAFRSFLPRADVQRICLVDSWFSTVLVGRFVATIAELSLMAQVALMVRSVSTELGVRSTAIVARFIVPAIAIAEVCSWYAVVTTNFLCNTFEESIWAATSLVVSVCLGYLSFRTAGGLRRFLRIGAGLSLAHVVVNSFIDVPMYATRYLADQRAGKAYAGAVDGLRDLATRWVVTFRWSDWHDELAWMALYFSVAVWASLALVQAPRLWTKPS
jgi:hypothetical protein